MKIKSVFRAILLVAAMAAIALSTASCGEKGPAGGDNAGGTISGIVKDSQGNLIEGVTVSAKGIESTAKTDANGEYVLTGVAVGMYSVSFEKAGYQTANVTVPKSRFDANGNAKVNATLNFANAKITGKVLDGMNGNAPLAGASVKLSNADETTVETDDKGVYVFENLTIQDYTITISADEYVSITMAVTEAMFDNEEQVAEVEDVVLTKTQLLPGLTLNDLQKADKWYYNEYRGGSNGE